MGSEQLECFRISSSPMSLGSWNPNFSQDRPILGKITFLKNHQFVPICSRDPQWATTAGTCYQCNQSHRSDWSLRYNPPCLPTLWPNHILAFIAEYTLTPHPGWLALSLSKNRINTQQASDYSPGWLSQFFSYLLVQGRQRVNSGPR